MVKVKIPNSLQELTGSSGCLELEAGNIGELMRSIGLKYPNLKNRICDGQGNLKKIINVYINDENINSLGGIDATLKNEDIVYIVPPIAGG